MFRRKYSVLALLIIVLFSSTYVWQFNGHPPALEAMTTPYFHEVAFTSTSHHFGAVSHCDARFAPSKPLSPDETRESMKALLRSFTYVMDQKNIITWIAHGTLLGWWWNQKLLPWDTDLDIQMLATDLDLLADIAYIYTNLGRTYILDVNPFHTNFSKEDTANKIDARWIDTTDGKYIDITLLRQCPADSAMLCCKDGHTYLVSLFQSQPPTIPHKASSTMTYFLYRGRFSRP